MYYNYSQILNDIYNLLNDILSDTALIPDIQVELQALNESVSNLQLTFQYLLYAVYALVFISFLRLIFGGK